VNVAIKNGANQFHGSLYDYLQNDMFEPQNPMNVYNNVIYGVPLPAKNSFKQNQYGFTFGGPVLIPNCTTDTTKLSFSTPTRLAVADRRQSRVPWSRPRQSGMEIFGLARPEWRPGPYL